MTYRTKWMVPDFRRDPKTDCYCEMCQRDLKPGQPHRHVMYELDRYEAVHSDDWEIAAIDIIARRAPHLSSVVTGEIGMDCAKRLGLEFSRQAP